MDTVFGSECGARQKENKGITSQGYKRESTDEADRGLSAPNYFRHLKGFLCGALGYGLSTQDEGSWSRK